LFSANTWAPSRARCRGSAECARFGGVRIEDNVRAVAGAGPENLSRDAFAED
jgi:hypothetical protein